MNPRTRRQRRQARKWGPLGWNYRGYGFAAQAGGNAAGRMKVLCPIGHQGDPWATRMRWYTPSRD